MGLALDFVPIMDVNALSSKASTKKKFVTTLTLD